MTTAFDSWLAKQFEEGLVDIKFAVQTGRGVSAEAIRNEMMAAQAAIAAGYTVSAPTPTSQMPQAVAEFIAAH